MRAKFSTITSGLDQLYFSPLLANESLENRAEAVENFIQQNGWSWDQIIEQMSKENSNECN